MALFTRSRRSRKPRIDMVSMIDVMFFLVLFFMIFTTFRTHDEGIPVNLPRAASGQTVTVTELVVSVTKDGTYYIGTEPVTLIGLQSAAAAMLADEQRVVAFIRGDEDTPWRWIAAAMGAIQEGGVEEVVFLVEDPSNDRLI